MFRVLGGCRAREKFLNAPYTHKQIGDFFCVASEIRKEIREISKELQVKPRGERTTDPGRGKQQRVL